MNCNKKTYFNGIIYECHMPRGHKSGCISARTDIVPSTDELNMIRQMREE